MGLMAQVDRARSTLQSANEQLSEARELLGLPKQEAPKEPEEKGLFDKLKGIGHTALDVAGFVPGLGTVADLAHAAWYLAEGDKINAALAAASAVPFAGDAFAAAKLGNRAVDAVRTADNAIDAARGADNAIDAAKVPRGSGGGGNVAPEPSTLHTRGYHPQPGERTINGYVDREVEKAGGEITSIRPSGIEINRAGHSGTHYIGDSNAAHIHQRYRDVAPDGTVREGISDKNKANIVAANERHIKELYKALDRGTFRTRGGR